MNYSKRFRIPALVTGVGFLLWATGAAYAGYFLSGTLGKGYNLLPGSTSQVVCQGEMTASSYLVNTEETVTLQLKAGADPGNFIGRIEHNRSAPYTFAGVYRYLMVVNGQEFYQDKASCSFSRAGDYTIKGYLTFYWETTPGKVSAGFARYYYKTMTFTRVIRVTDLEKTAGGDGVLAQPTGGEQETEEEKVEPILSGSVGHSAQWERNRETYNAYCRQRGKTDLLRSEDTFWPGERFLLQADAQGEKPPSRVDVRIEGTDYSTILQFNGDGWSGSLFDEEMIYAFGQEKAETLVFLFSAVIDGVYCQDRCSITVDGRDPYWLMHRKE